MRRWLLCIILLTCLLAGCGGTDNGRDQSSAVEKGIIVIREEVPEYPALEAQSVMEKDADAADDPAGLLQDSCSEIMVKVEAGGLQGSGVIIASDRKYVWIATAGHVVEERQDPAVVTFVDGYETETADIVRLDSQDLAVLRIKRAALVEQVNGAEEDHGIYYRCASLSKDAFDRLQVGDLVIAMGSRSGVAEDAYAGTVVQDYVYLSDFEANMTVADVYVSPGMSGGGLFDGDGNLLGIICGVAEDGEVAVSPVLSLLALELGDF